MKKLILHSFLVLLFIFLSETKSKSQNYYFDNYSVKEGLAQSKVHTIFQDKSGYLWLGTAAGVSSFDGINFKNYTTEDGLATNGVRTITQHSSGSFWFGHIGGGISRLKNKKIEKIEIDSLVGNITDIYEDNKNNIWIGTYGSGVYRISNPQEKDKKKLIIKQFKGGEIGFSDLVFQIMQTKKGTLYFIVDKVIKYYDESTKSFKDYVPKNLPQFFQFTAMYEDNQENIWFGTYHGGLYKLSKNGKIETYNTKNGLADNWISTITQDSKNQIWIGTWGGGISVLKNNKFKTFNDLNGLNDLKIWSIAEDIEGNILIGSNEHGMFIFKGEQFISYNENSGINGNNIWSILEDRDNNFWFGTNKGISIINKDNFYKENNKYHNFENGDIPSNQIRFIKEDKNGNIWIGTGNSGVFEYIKKDKSFDYNFLINRYISNDRIVTSMEIDNSNNLWIGTADGLINYEINTDKIARISNEFGLAGNDISALFSDSKNKLWIGAFAKGITIYNDKDTNFNILDSKTIFTPTAITEDSKGKIWVGTDAQGIFVYENYKIVNHFKMQDGLLADFITAILSDNEGNIYIGTSRGLNKFSIKDNRFYSFTAKTGFTGIEVKDNAICKDKSGNIWFGTVRGAIKLNKKAEHINMKEPITHINKLRVNLVEKPLTENLSLRYDENSVIFDYVSICLSNSEAVSYKVMLEGADNDWLPETKQTFTNYSGLPSGQYTFKVLGKNNNGIWNKKPQTYSFTIRPPFWKSLWFYLLIAIVSISSIILYIKVRESNLISEKKILEEKVEERTKEIRKKNEELEVKNKNITDSIIYAKRIQDAMLPEENYMNSILKDHFIFFKPRDIVSGDYYWASLKNNKLVFAAVDCTGHGVPGAFMSMLGITLLDEIVNKKNVTEAGTILNEMRDSVIKSLKQQGKRGETQDGMDIALCSLDTQTLKMQYAGAYNPLYIIRNKELIKYKANRMPIGIYYKKTLPFYNNEIQLQKNDVIYLFSDGYIDQFNGETGEKLMTTKFKEYLMQIHELPMIEQKEILENKLKEWRGSTYQVDDILILGVRIS
ncbi:MAG: SpoIIE family protein phosphatase [Bacteroidales bacterium]|nr:SpoIIE family protein phosphatase [Bacteroidales bacterium]MBN2757406.1 SpoIIE family protein phosphatase [Bacteroidales bacterium]